MTFETDFVEFMDRTITVQAFGSYSTDGYGGKSYSTTSYSVACYIADQVKLVKDQTGREVVSMRTLYCAPYDTSTGKVAVYIGPSDKITLPSGFTPQTPTIINVQRLDDENGRHVQVVSI